MSTTATGGGEQRSDHRLSTTGTRPPELEHLPCPRCHSTNTKFCYYNNYNLSQPRHFCKSCRRYWTRGGTLRNVPVGGGSRKSSSSSSHKRPRNNNQPSSDGPNTPISTSVSPSSGIVAQKLVPGSDSGPMTGGSLAASFDVNLNEAVPEALSLSSLLTTHAGTGGYMPFGLGFDLDPGSPSLNGIGFGLGADWPMESVCQANNDGGGGSGGGGENGGSGGSSGCNTWQIGGVDGGLGTDGDCFGWPDLAISMSGKGLK